jgi:two-component system sensor histidine kinase CpxA
MRITIAAFGRSLRGRILVSHFITLLVSLAAFIAIEGTVGLEADRTRMRQLYRLQVEGAVHAYEQGGAPELSAFLTRLDRSFTSTHYLLDTDNRDLVSGDILHPVLSAPGTGAMVRLARRAFGVRTTFAVPSPDTRYRLLYVDAQQWQNVPAQAPYYLVVLIITAVAYSYLSVGIASSLKTISRTADRFGEGDLNARVPPTTRQDEIGNLARSFNGMADHIATLLVAERRLLQDVSHELRSPLARLAFAIELSRTASDRDASHARIKKELDSLSGLVASLVEVTRAEGDPLAQTMERLSLAELLRDVVDSCALDAQASDRTVNLSVTSSPVVRGNRELLRRAFDNVIRNAVRHAPTSSPVMVSLGEEDRRAIVAVRDMGEGVSDTLLERIFEPFFRSEDPHGERTAGVGLGLSIVRRVIELHQGSATARNAHPGLCVTLTLPISGSAPDGVFQRQPRVAAPALAESQGA